MTPVATPRFPVLLLAGCFALLAGCSRSGQGSQLERAEDHLAAGEYSRAEIEFANVLREDPRNARALSGLGRLYFDQGRLLRALPVLNAARQVAPDDLEVRRLFALGLVSAGRRDDARTEALHILQARPDHAEALMLLAELATTPDEIRAARERIAAIPESNAATAAVLSARAMLDLRANDSASAETHITRALGLDPEFSHALALQAVIHGQHGDAAAAKAAYLRSARTAPARSIRRVLVAQYCTRSGDTEDARQLLDETLSAAPDFFPALFARTELAFTENDPAGAGKMIERLLAIDPTLPDVQLLAARLQIARGEFAAAEEELRKLAEANPDAAPVHFHLARAQLAGPNQTAAMNSLARVVALQADNTEAALLLATLRIRRGDTATAILNLREMTQKYPRLEAAWMLLAEAYQRQGNPAAALETLTRVQEQFPDRPQAIYLSGLLLRQQGRVAEAREKFTAIYETHPGFALAADQLVNMDLQEGRTEEAWQRASEFAGKFPDLAEGQMLIARVALARKQIEPAEQALRRAIELRPEHAAGYMMLAQLLLENGRGAEALQELENAATRNARDPSLHMLIGLLSERSGAMDRARLAYEEAVRQNPQFVAAMNNLAYLYSEHDKDLERAFDMADRARRLAPKDPYVLDTFGWILFQRGDYAWARNLFLESASSLTDHADVQLHLGLAHHMLAEETEARTALRAYLDSAPQGDRAEEARTCLALLEADPTADPAGARRLAETRLETAPEDPVAMLRLARAHEQDDRIKEAQKLFDRAHQQQPRNPRIAIAYARFLERRDDPSRAYTLAKAAYEEATGNPEIAHTVGRLAYLAGDHPWAASILQDAARQRPDDVALLTDLADALFSTGDLDGALAALRRASAGDLDPAARSRIERRGLLIAFALRPATPPDSATTDAIRESADAPPALLAQAILDEQDGRAGNAISGYEQLLARMPACTPAALRLAALYTEQPEHRARAQELVQIVRRGKPDDPEAQRLLGILAYHERDYARAAPLLRQSAARFPQQARISFLLGVSLRHLQQPEEGNRALQQALDRGLEGEDAAEARRLLADADQS